MGTALAKAAWVDPHRSKKLALKTWGCGVGGDAIKTAKLNSKINAENSAAAAKAKDAQLMAEWDEKLPQYPKWCF